MSLALRRCLPEFAGFEQQIQQRPGGVAPGAEATDGDLMSRRRNVSNSQINRRAARTTAIRRHVQGNDREITASPWRATISGARESTPPKCGMEELC